MKQFVYISRGVITTLIDDIEKIVRLGGTIQQTVVLRYQMFVSTAEASIVLIVYNAENQIL